VPQRRRDLAAGIFLFFSLCVWAADRLFRDDVDRMTFVRFLTRTGGAIGWGCIAMCLMGTHYHLILEVEDNDLAAGMHRLNLAYARYFNKRYTQRGHVLFDRYGADRIRSDAHLLDRYAYVALNPVRAGICSRPESWPWSSYGDAIGAASRFPFVEPARVLTDRLDPQAELRRYVEANARHR
jgi:REP element-mobilizing transposase RayT